MSKKICHILISYGNKNQKYTQDLLENLNESSNDEHFIYCHRNHFDSAKIQSVVSVKQPKVKALFQLIKLCALSGDFRKLAKKLSSRNIYKWLWLISYKIDVVHIHHSHAIPTEVIQYFKDQGVKIIITLRGRDLLVNTENVIEFEHLKNKIGLADEIHCISHFMQNKLFQLYGLKATVIYRGLQLPGNDAIKMEHTPSFTIKIIAAGRLVWEKGHIYLIESIHRLIKEGYLFQVDIYGDGDLKEFLQFRINQLGIDKIINLKGFVENATLKKLYKNYDFAVQPSLSEALSNGLIDFMFHNLPCVITDVGGMTEVIEHKKNGIVFAKENMLLLDDAILNIKNIDFQEMIHYNKAISNKFTSKSEVDGLLKLYE